MSWDHPSPFIEQRHVIDAHIDGLQHTNNGVYVMWCGEAAWAHSQSLGLGLAEYQALDRAMAVTEAKYNYLRATRVGDVLKIGTWIAGWDSKLTMERRFQIIHAETGHTVLRASMIFACIEISSGRPRRMPQAFIDGYEPAVLATRSSEATDTPTEPSR